MFFTKEVFNELLNRKQWDHTTELIPNASNFSTKVYPCLQSNRNNWTNSWMKILRANAYDHQIAHGLPHLFNQKKDGSLCLVQDY